MSSFTVVNRSPDGTTYFDQSAMGNWTYASIVELVQGAWNGAAYNMDYLTIQMSGVSGFPQLFFRLYGHFNIQNLYNSFGVLKPYVMAGSIINRIDVIDVTGKIYNSLDGISFAVNSNKTTFNNEAINSFANSFLPGETPFVDALLSGNDLIQGNAGTEVLFGYNGNDTMYGYGGSDGLYGGAGNDSLIGGAAGDDLYGGAGNDTFVGYEGPDYLDGGADFDTWALTGTFASGLGLQPRHDYGNVSFFNIEAVRITWGEIVLNANQVGGVSTVQTVIGGSNDRDALRITAIAGVVTNLATVTFQNWNNYSGEMDQLTTDGTGGNDTIYGATVNEVIWAGEGNNLVHGNSGDDRLNGGSGMDSLHGNAGSDTLVGWGGADYLQGGTDGVTGYDGDDSLYGGDGNDTLVAGRGFDRLDGGADTDTADYRNVLSELANAASIVGGVVHINLAGNSAGAWQDLGGGISVPMFLHELFNIENVLGTKFNDSITGSAGANNLNGQDGNDSLLGGGGNDTLIGGYGDDLIDGGADTDLLILWENASVSVNLGLATAQNTGQGTDTILNVENAITGNFNDKLWGNAAGNLLDARAGNDTLDGRQGNDSLYGGVGDDILVGGDGDDLIDGGADTDTLIMFVPLAISVNLGVTGAQVTGQGTDIIRNVERVISGDMNDRLTGNTAANLFDARGGNDTLNGLDGNDSLYGGAGNDMMLGGNGNDLIDGGADFDVLNMYGTAAIRVDLSVTGAQVTGQGTDIIRNMEQVISGELADTISGNGASNYLDARGGNDILNGRAGNDSLFGGADNDTLNGGTQNDLMLGGAGTDRFLFNAGDGTDTIRGWEDGLDRIVIDSGATSFAGVTVADMGAHVRVSFGTNVIIIENLAHTLITAADFSFI
ncbi:calcium-binding protein [Gemmobacter caeruleus]|uniref:calcium-binding protein n=1 Tax=Gemmobacter caeruleus TaxID=2595004 RepID=UPI0011EF04B0|nr:calcium-binding protein [Gemmobacter caeruleus]